MIGRVLSKLTLLFVIACLACGPVGAQYMLLERPAPAIERDGVQQVLADCGGLNNAQLSLADLDGDGLDELYVFDRDGDVHLAFRIPVSSDEPYEYAPELTEDWPPAIAFSLLRDFDADGVPDLFTHSDAELRQGIAVYQGFRQNDGSLRFEQVQFPDYPADALHFGDQQQDRTLMFVAISDIPAIEDLDGDGDLDVLSFDNAGGYIHHYINNGSRTSDARSFLRFEESTNCYGGAYESGLDGIINLADMPGICAPSDFQGGLQPRSGLHPGSTVTPSDIDADGDLDLLLGDVNTPFVTVLTNAPGADGEVFFNEVSYDWPSEAVAVDLENFPGVYNLARSREGASGLQNSYVATPSNPGNGEDYDCLWRYEPSADASGELELIQRDFLTREAFDHGRGAHLAWGDFNGDGEQDMLVGNDSRFAADGATQAELAYYESDGVGGYSQQSPDWLSKLNAVLSPSLLGLDPVAHDMDGDGDEDLLVGGDLGYISYAENLAGPGQAVAYAPLVTKWMDIDVGSRSSPAVGDVSGDGLPDLIIGERRGKLAYFINRGTTSEPMFSSSADEDSYGGIDVRLSGSLTSVNARPFLYPSDDPRALYIGTGQGRMLIYSNLPSEAGGTATLFADQQLGEGLELSPSIGIDSEGRTIASIGTSRGGVAFYSLDQFSSLDERINLAEWSIAPNPSSGRVTVAGVFANSKVSVVDLIGRQQLWTADELDQLTLAPGVYVLTPIGYGGQPTGISKRLVVLRQ